MNKEQLYKFLESFPCEIKDSIESGIDFIDIDPNDFEKALGMLSEFSEISGIFKDVDKTQLKKDELEIKIYQPPFDKNVSLDFDDGSQIIIVDGSYETVNSIKICEYTILIVCGDISCKNLIVNGYLFTTGNVECNVLYGSSGNDHQTHIYGDIKSMLIAENGHYTICEGKITTNYLITIHNEITGRKGCTVIKQSLKDRNRIKEKLSDSVLDKEKYFDEENFLNFIESENTEEIMK